MGIIVFVSFLISLLAIDTGFAVYGGGTIGYNPMGGGFLTGPTPPPFYSPGPGNLMPSFSYVQQPNTYGFGLGSPGSSSSLPLGAGAGQSLMNAEAKKVIGKWRQRVISARGNPTLIPIVTSENIKEDRNILKAARDTRGLSNDDINNIDQIRLVLNLAEIRFLTKILPAAKKRFPEAFKANVDNDAASNTDPNDTNAGPLPKTWYISKTNQLQALLKDFRDFLNQHPEYYNNPPELLVGLQDTLVQGQKALESYQKFSSCLVDPDIPYCEELSREEGADPDAILEDEGNAGTGQPSYYPYG